MAFFVGIDHGWGADLAGIETGFPAETAARGVDGLRGVEGIQRASEDILISPFCVVRTARMKRQVPPPRESRTTADASGVFACRRAGLVCSSM